MCSLSHTCWQSFTVGAGGCIDQHPKCIPPNVVEKKLEMVREHPEMRLELIAERASKLE